ncbi:MAG: DUF4350 domain-containing protein [Lewinella sp.]|nr:DUF4350 domain-containing protein [Lewinella sp.]
MPRNRLILVIGLALLIALVLLVLSRRSQFSWRENYRMDSKDPYGTYALHDLLSTYTGTHELTDLRDSLSEVLPTITPDGPASYVFVGEGMYMRPEDRDALLAFVEAGNTAFVSCKTPPHDLMFHLYYDECPETPWHDFDNFVADSVQLNLAHPHLRRDTGFAFTFIEDQRPSATYWRYFNDDYFCGLTNGFDPLGYLNESLVNFVRIPLGEGWFYLHSTPQVLTNYFLVTETGRQYAERLLSHLPDGPLYWDEYSRIPDRLARDFNQDNMPSDQDRRRLQSQGPLQYILEQPPLAWAWYLLLLTGLLYMIFRAKRRQRVIPVLEPKRNTSLNFVQNVGRWYFQKSGHQQVAHQAIKLLRGYVWERYGLQWRQDEQFLQQLANRSGVSPELLAAIAKDVNNIPRYTGLVEPELIKFNQRLEQFYRTAK